MKKIILILSVFALSLGLQAQTAKQILDKTSSVLKSYSTATADFTASSKSGSMTGSITLQGQKFRITGAGVSIWFDGTTLWTMQNGSDEVNVTTPTSAELQRMNPYTFLNIYKNGFDLSAKTVGNNYEVTLKAQKTVKDITSMVVTVNKKTYLPSKVVMTTKKSSMTLTIANLKKCKKKADSYFKFDKKQYPKVEIIDLR